MALLHLLLPPLAAAVISFSLTPLVMRLSHHLGAIDHPGTRKVHLQPVPRLGGLAVVASVFLVLGTVSVLDGRNPSLLSERNFVLGLALGFLPIFFISFWDDLRPLRPVPKLLAQLAGAFIALGFGIRLPSEIHLFGNPIHIGLLALPISVLWIVGVTNAFNLVDGLDGLSSGLALISALSLAGVSGLVALYGMASASLILAGALLGFLPYNIYPARIFLGDTGSTAIGFCLACLALRGGSALAAGLAVLLPLVVLGLPVAETLISMARRVVRRLDRIGGGGIFDADSEHFHHRLLALGLEHRHAVLTLYGVGVALAVCGFASLFFNNQGAALLLLTLLIAAFIGVKRLGYDEFALLRKGVVLRVADAPALKAALFTVFADLAAVVLAIYGAIVVKYDDWGLSVQRPLAEYLIALLPLTTLVVFYSFKLYRGTWRQASVEDLLQSTWAVVASTLVGYGLVQISFYEAPPVTFFMIYGLILLAFVNGARASYRLLFHWSRRAASGGQPVLIYSAGRGGSMALRELLSNEAIGMRPIGFIDDDRAKIGRYVNGYPVKGTVENIERLISECGVGGVIVASAKIRRERLALAQSVCLASGAWLRMFRVEIRPIPNGALADDETPWSEGLLGRDGQRISALADLEVAD